MPDLTDNGASAAHSSGTHSLTFFLACCKSSEILYKLYGNLLPNQNPPYEAVLSLSLDLERISQSLPLDLQRAMQSTAVPLGLVNTGRVIGMLLAYRTYLIHRAYFVRLFKDSAYRKSYTAYIQASETIIDLSNRGLQPTFYRLWTTTLWLVAAGIVLSLDLIHAASQKRVFPNISSRRKGLAELQTLLLTRADTSGIGSRGAMLIGYLCAIERGISVARLPAIQITRKIILDLVATSNGGFFASESEPAACYDSQQETWPRPSL